MKTTDKIIIIDLEATCWREETCPVGQENEIIEIGLAVLDSKTGEITQNQGILVKPTRSSVSPFCTELTTITQELLDENGLSFEEAIKQLVDEYQPHLYTWASYGMFDIKKLKQQCKSFGITYPMRDEHINVKTYFTEKFGVKKARGMKGALNLLNISLEGTHHRGVDDARNIAKILYKCLQN